MFVCLNWFWIRLLIRVVFVLLRMFDIMNMLSVGMKVSSMFVISFGSVCGNMLVRKVCVGVVLRFCVVLSSC